MSELLDNLLALQETLEQGATLEDYQRSALDAQLLCAFRGWRPTEWGSEMIFLAKDRDDRAQQGRLASVSTSMDAVDQEVERLRKAHGVYMVYYEFDDEPSDTNHYGRLLFGRGSPGYTHTAKYGEAVGCSNSYASAMCLALLDLLIAAEKGMAQNAQ